MERFTAVITAFEVSEAMKSSKPNALNKMCGVPMLRFVIDAVKDAGAEKVISISGTCEVPGCECDFAESTAAAISRSTSKIAVVCRGDMPLLDSRSIKDAVTNHVLSQADVTLVNSGKDNFMYIFNTCEIVKAAESTELLDFEKLAENIGKAGKTVLTYSVEDEVQATVVTDRIKLSEAESLMQEKINRQYMADGVTIHNPSTVIIEPGVKIGVDCEIYPNVILQAGTVIGKNVLVGSGSRLSGAKIGDGTDIQSSVIIDSEIGSNTHVGPFAYVRPNCCVGDEVKVGDFVELKNANIGSGTKISHLTYVGDADVGEKCNFGCGTVTVNYDGKKKYRTRIGDNVFIGCNSNLVAPVTLKSGAYTAAGSTITDEVPENTLAIARARQINKSTWNDRRK